MFSLFGFTAVLPAIVLLAPHHTDTTAPWMKMFQSLKETTRGDELLVVNAENRSEKSVPVRTIQK